MANQIRKHRKKINLAHKRKGKNNMDDMVWYIGLNKNRKTFYVTDYDDDNNAVLWSRKKEDCISFKTERGVHRFIHKHLHNRTDIFLVHSPSD